MRQRYIQDPKTLRLIPAEEYRRNEALAHEIMPDIEPFRSMVDGSVIRTRPQLRAHMRQHGVVRAEDMENTVAAAQRKRQDFLEGRPYDTERRLDAVRFAVELHERRRTPGDIREMVDNYKRRGN